jgi:2-C-methyl-D-erythritol 4-phosphate cytidylyltransferase
VAVLALLPVPDAATAEQRLGGRSLLDRSVAMLQAAGLERIVVLASAGSSLHVPPAGSRLEQIDAATFLAREQADVIVVHDPLRPLAPRELVDAVVHALSQGASAAAPVLRVTDTLKELAPDDRVVATVERDAFQVLQTPQAFTRPALVAALAGPAAGLLDAFRYVPGAVTVGGSPSAVRIGSRDELQLAEAMLGSVPADGN